MLLASCGSEHTPLGPNEAMLVINMPSMKSSARALDTKGSPIPAEVTEILFEVADAAGTKIGEAQDFLKVKSVQFALGADRNYTITGTAKFGTVTLYQGSETVAALQPGETRNVAVSLLAKIKFALSVTSDVQTPQGGTGDASPTVQWKLGQTKEIKVDVEGLDDKTIVWSVNDIPGGDATLGTVSPQGTYTPPAVIPANPNIRIKAVPAAAPSFDKNVDVKLIPQPGNSDLPSSSASPPGGVFTSAQTVILSCTACSAIYFTDDGSEPTTASSPYSGPIGVGAPTVLKFFAVNAIGNAEDTHNESYTFIVPPAAPTNLNANAGDGRIDLAWVPVAGATGYNVYRGTASGVSTGGTPIGTVTTPSFTSIGLTNGVTYYFKVVATNVAGSGPDSAEVIAKPLPALPAAPVNVAATASNAQVALTWPAVNGATGYRVFRSTTTGTATSQPALADVAVPSYTDVTVTNGTIYYYQVEATNLAGASPPSTEVSAKPLPPLPAAPTNLIATASDSQVVLSWAAVTGATEYRIYRTTTAGVSTSGVPVGTVTTLSFTSMGLTNGTTYYFKVVAANLAGPGPVSAEVNAKPLPPLPAAPANFTASAGNTQVALSWGVVAGATEYRVFQSTISGNFGAYTTVKNTSYTSLSLTNGTHYYFTVAAVNIAGPGPASTEIVAKPLPASVTVYANVTGLNPLSAGGAAGSSLVLKNNGGDNLTINTNGLFAFATKVLMNNPYNVTVATQPTNPAQTCTVTPPASGTITLSNVTINVACVTNNYTVGGAVTGLVGSGFVLVNGGKVVALTAGNAFSVTLPSGTGYGFSVTAHPSSPTQFCTVTNGNGIVVSANISNVAVSCVTTAYLVGGTLSGISSGTTLTLNNMGSDPINLNADGPFNFPSKVLSGGQYNVTFAKQPLGQNCIIDNGSGSVGSADVSTIAVSCVVTHIPRYAFVTNRGENTVSSFVIEAATGRMKFVSKATTGNYPTGVAVDPRGQFAYVANNFSHDVSQYRIQPDGSLTPITGKTVPTGLNPWAITVEPNSKYVYVTNDGEGTTGQYLIGGKGELTEIGKRISTGGTSPRSITADPSGRFLYAANMNSDNVAQYEIQSDGTLVASAKPILTGDAPQSIVIDATGKFAYVANNFSHSVSAYAVDAKGILSRITCAAVCAANDPASFATGNYPWAVATPVTGKFLYVTNDGDGTVSQFTISATGQLSTITTAIGTGTSPRSLIVDPSGTYAYAANINSDDVSLYTITGKGNLVPNSPTVVSGHANPSAMAISGGSAAVEAVAKSVYVSDEGVAGASIVRQYGIGADGSLSGIAKGVVSALQNPRGVAIDPIGKNAYVANDTLDGGFLMQYPIAADGSLGVARTTALRQFNPLSVAIHPTGKYAYVTHGNANASLSPNAITQFSIAADGTLAPIGVRQGDGVYPAGIASHPSGKFIYVANFYGNGGKIAGSVSQYTVSSKDGSLQPIASKPYALTGNNPFGVTIDPTGRYAYVTNFGAATISQFNVNSDGSLSSMATPTVGAGAGPISLVIHPSGQFAYVPNLGNGVITEYSIGADGSLTMMTSLETGEKSPIGLALDATGNYLYVTNNGGNTVSQYRVEKTGILTKLVPSTVKTDGAPSGIATLGSYK